MSNSPYKSFNPKILSVILIVSLCLNIIVIKNYTNMVQKQNTMWSNSISSFAQVVNLVSISSKHLTKDVNEYRLDNINQNLYLLRRQLRNLEILPYSNEIVPWETREKIRLFINYEANVVNIMQQEFEQNGKISEENKKRMKVIYGVWESILMTLEKESNSLNPFAYTFNPNKWRQVWDKALTVFDRVELIPLPEE